MVSVVAEAGRGGGDMLPAAQATALLSASAEQVKQAAQKWPKRDAQVCWWSVNPEHSRRTSSGSCACPSRYRHLVTAAAGLQ